MTVAAVEVLFATGASVVVTVAVAARVVPVVDEVVFNAASVCVVVVAVTEDVAVVRPV